RFMLTAEAELALKNSFGMAESIGLSFQNLQFQSPRLQVNALLPYMLGTRFGADVTFDLYKRDTSFQRVSIDIGLRYLINASDFFRVSYRQQNNRMISFNEAVVIQQKQLPDNVDLSNRGVNVAYQLSHTNYKPNPRKGYEAGLQMGGYFRQVKKNPAISGITDGSGYDYGQLYDSLEQRLVQYRIEAQAALYIPLARQLSLKLGYEGAYLLGDQFFQNELFQIGGFKRLRGFDEQSIFANQFHIATLELRLLLAGDA